MNSLHFGHNPKWQKISGENDAMYFARALTAVETSLSSPNADADKAMLAQLRTYQVMMESFAPSMEVLFGSSVEPFMKQATARFIAEHGKAPDHMGDIAKYFDDIPQFAAVARPIAAEMEYMADHDGQRPTDPSQLKPYLTKPFHELRLLRLMRLTVEGEKVNMKLHFGN